MEKTKKLKNELIGEVVSSKADKTITVKVYQLIRHKKYGKFIRKSSKFMAHDEKNEAKSGDQVKIFECRPYSKQKRWMLGEVVTKRQDLAEVNV